MKLFDLRFEPGDFSEWDQISVWPPDYAEVVSDVKYSGNFSGMFVTTAASRFSRASKIFAVTDVFHWRGEIRINKTPGAGNNVVFFVLLGGETAPRIPICQLIFTSEELLLDMRFPEQAWKGYSFVVQPMGFYTIEIEFVRGVNGGYKVWLNEVEVISVSADTSMAPYPSMIINGIHWCAGEAFKVWIDSVVGAQEYIGRELPPPPPPNMGTLDCHAYYNDTEVGATVEVVEVGTYTTPFTLELAPGNYTLRCTYEDETKETLITIVDGQITTEDFRFAEVELTLFDILWNNFEEFSENFGLPVPPKPAVPPLPFETLIMK